MWLVFLLYLAVGVILWYRWPLLRDSFHEAGHGGGMILAAFIWPFMLMYLAVIGIVLLVIWLFENLSRLFRHKR